MVSEALDNSVEEIKNVRALNVWEKRRKHLQERYFKKVQKKNDYYKTKTNPLKTLTDLDDEDIANKIKLAKMGIFSFSLPCIDDTPPLEKKDKTLRGKSCFSLNIPKEAWTLDKHRYIIDDCPMRTIKNAFRLPVS